MAHITGSPHKPFHAECFSQCRWRLPKLLAGLVFAFWWLVRPGGAAAVPQNGLGRHKTVSAITGSSYRQPLLALLAIDLLLLTALALFIGQLLSDHKRRQPHHCFQQACFNACADRVLKAILRLILSSYRRFTPLQYQRRTRNLLNSASAP